MQSNSASRRKWSQLHKREEQDALDLSIKKGIAVNKAEELSRHPYLAGNFRPVRKEFDLLPCELLTGLIPEELAGGQYLRNGANAYFPPAAGQGYHLYVSDITCRFSAIVTKRKWVFLLE